MASFHKDCLFCKMVQGSIPVSKVYEDEVCICIRDIRPQASTHLLVIPKFHTASLETAFPESGGGESRLLGELYERVVKVARLEKLLPGGFRTVVNTNQVGGQTVFSFTYSCVGRRGFVWGFWALGDGVGKPALNVLSYSLAIF
jgi:histidine triad (HIT) family protein